MFFLELVGSMKLYRCLKQAFMWMLLFVVMLLICCYISMSRVKKASREADIFCPTVDNVTTESTKETSNNSPNYGQDSLSTNDRTPDSEFLKRRRVVQDVCTSLNIIPGHVQDVYSHRQAGVIYCAVAKTGCTFWKRVFYFVKHQASNGSFKSPFDISRHAIHNFSNHTAEDYSKLKHRPRNYPVRFMVTRDPMSRLIASYLDKLYLPDFWSNIGKKFVRLSEDVRKLGEYIGERFDQSNILNHQSLRGSQCNKSSRTIKDNQARDVGNQKSDDDFLRKHFDTMAVMLNSSLNLPTSKEDKCGKYITFSDFVKMSLYYPNGHWDSIYQLCDPCQFVPTHIIRMETFSADAKSILSQLGLEHVLDYFDSVAQINEELTIVVNYHFKVAFSSRTSPLFSDCLTARELAFRLWNNFRWKGYIHPQMDYTLPSYTDTDRVHENLMSQIWRAREFGLRQPKAMKKMKSEFAQKLISTLSKNVLEEFMWKYRLDYDLFEYSKLKI